MYFALDFASLPDENVEVDGSRGQFHYVIELQLTTIVNLFLVVLSPLDRQLVSLSTALDAREL